MESFEEFKESFYYGTRSDLSFKFLRNIADADAAEFLRRVLEEVGEALDTGDASSLIDLAIAGQIEGWGPDPARPSRWQYDDRPFAPLQKPLADSRIGLLTSSGHFAAGDDPEPFGVPDMTQEEAENRIMDFIRDAPILSPISRELPAAELRVRHGGYDVRGAMKDHNVNFPRDPLVAAAAEGRVGDVADTLYSFPGATAQGRVKQLSPDWARQFHEDEIDVLLLVPV